MRTIRNLALLSSLTVSSLMAFGGTQAHAECAAYTRRDTGSLVILPIYKYQVGSTAFANLMNIGFDEAGRIIGGAHDWLGDCSYPGIGISAASGSGEMIDGIYPNDASVVYAIYGGGINISVARSAIYAAISVLSEPTPPVTTTTIQETTSWDTTTTSTTITTSTTTIAPSTTVPVTIESTTTTLVPTTTVAPATTVASASEEDNDGVVENDYAELIINKVGTRYQIQIDSSYQNYAMKIQARISNRRIVTWNITTDSNGHRGFYTSRNLAGFNVSLWVAGTRFDTVGVK